MSPRTNNRPIPLLQCSSQKPEKLLVADDMSASGPSPTGPDSSGPDSSGPDSSGPDSSGPGPSHQDRDRYLRLLDSALSRGLLGDADYMLRADALLRATSVEQMNTIVQQLPLLASPPKSPPATSRGSRRRRTDEQIDPPLTSPLIETNEPQASQSQTSRPIEHLTPYDDLTHLDPVDVAMLMRSRQTRKPSQNRRAQALAVVGILFLVLIVLGVLLALHNRPVNGSGGIAPPHHP